MGDLFPERIETDRLVLEALRTDAADPLIYYEYASAEHADEVTTHLPWDPHDQPKESLDAIRDAEEAREADEHPEYVVRPRESGEGVGEFAGTTGIYPKWDRRTATFGIWSSPEFRGRGYSGERAAAMIGLAFDRLDLDLVAVAHMDGNEKSRRAVEKYVERFGGQYEGLLRNFQVNDDGTIVDMHRCTITSDQYENATEGIP
jgi:RimJ/RimL family protein N-acetyltransferase